MQQQLRVHIIIFCIWRLYYTKFRVAQRFRQSAHWISRVWFACWTRVNKTLPGYGMKALQMKEWSNLSCNNLLCFAVILLPHGWDHACIAIRCILCYVKGTQDAWQHKVGCCGCWGKANSSKLKMKRTPCPKSAPLFRIRCHEVNYLIDQASFCRQTSTAK